MSYDRSSKKNTPRAIDKINMFIIDEEEDTTSDPPSPINLAIHALWTSMESTSLNEESLDFVKASVWRS